MSLSERLRGVKMNNNLELIKGLRDFADFLEGFEHFPIIHYPPTYMFFDKKEFISLSHHIGNVKKDFSDDYAILQKHFGPITLELNTLRSNVCTKRVVGVEDVPEVVIPAHQKDIIEWDCEPLLSTDSSDESGE